MKTTMLSFLERLQPHTKTFFGGNPTIVSNGSIGQLVSPKLKQYGFHFHSINNTSDNVVRVTLSGMYPYDEDNRPVLVNNAPKISFSTLKRADKIWDDMMRRFLSEYIKVWDQCKSQIDSAIAYKRARERKVAGIIELCTKHKIEADIRGETVVIHKEPVYGDITVHPGGNNGLDSYNVELHRLNPMQFKAVITALGLES